MVYLWGNVTISEWNIAWACYSINSNTKNNLLEISCDTYVSPGLLFLGQIFVITASEVV